MSANYMPVKIRGTEITLVWTDLIVSLSLSFLVMMGSRGRAEFVIYFINQWQKEMYV